MNVTTTLTEEWKGLKIAFLTPCFPFYLRKKPAKKDFHCEARALSNKESL